MIMEKALKMAVVGPARVMMRSGQFPSEMLMRAPLWKGGKWGASERITTSMYLSQQFNGNNVQ